MVDPDERIWNAVQFVGDKPKDYAAAATALLEWANSRGVKPMEFKAETSWYGTQNNLVIVCEMPDGFDIDK